MKGLAAGGGGQPVSVLLVSAEPAEGGRPDPAAASDVLNLRLENTRYSLLNWVITLLEKFKEGQPKHCREITKMALKEKRLAHDQEASVYTQVISEITNQPAMEDRPHLVMFGYGIDGLDRPMDEIVMFSKLAIHNHKVRYDLRERKLSKILINLKSLSVNCRRRWVLRFPSRPISAAKTALMSAGP
jgi:hypothetical protein